MIPKRLLCFSSSMDAGGAETFLMKIYRNIDREKFQFDFLVNTKKESFYDNEIVKMGGKIYYVPPKSKNILVYAWKTYKIVKENNYEYVLRMTAHSLGSLDLLIAMIAGASQRALRATNAGNISGSMGKIFNKLFSWMPRRIPTVKIAPSTEAAEFLFGKGCIANHEVCLLKNAIPLAFYQYDKKQRNRIREEFDISSNFVIGHVGRFNKQKNHKFLIEVFSEVIKVKPEAILILVGKGELENDIREQILMLGLGDKVIFTGVRKDIPSLLMAMDIMIFPSFFEGMPNIIIEAQATGLPCLVSDSITNEVKLTDLIHYKSVKADDAKCWSKIVISKLDEKRDRGCYKQILFEAGYDINKGSEEFVKCIFK